MKINLHCTDERGVVMVKINTKVDIKGLIIDIDDNGVLTVANKEDSDTVNIVNLIKRFKGTDATISISKSEKGDFDESKAE